MIDDLAGERLTIQNRHLIIAASQRAYVDTILMEHCCPAVWSAGISGVERYAGNSSDDMRNVAVWSVAFDEIRHNALKLLAMPSELLVKPSCIVTLEGCDMPSALGIFFANKSDGIERDLRYFGG